MRGPKNFSQILLSPESPISSGTKSHTTLPMSFLDGVEDEDSLNEIREYIGNNPKRLELKRKL